MSYSDIQFMLCIRFIDLQFLMLEPVVKQLKEIVRIRQFLCLIERKLLKYVRTTLNVSSQWANV